MDKEHMEDYRQNVKAEKLKMERTILTAIQNFQDNTGLLIGDIDMERPVILRGVLESPIHITTIVMSQSFDY